MTSPEYSPSVDGELHPMYISHDARLALESEVWGELQDMVKDGSMTDDEAIGAFIYWGEMYPEIEVRHE